MELAPRPTTRCRTGRRAWSRGLASPGGAEGLELVERGAPTTSRWRAVTRGGITQCLHEPRRERIEVHRQGRVEVAVDAPRRHPRLSRRRYPGTGIAEDQARTRIFGEFRQADATVARASSAGPGLGSASRRNSSRCTAGASGSRASRARDRPSRSRSRCEWRGLRRHERQDHPLRRGQRAEPQDRPRSLASHLLSPDRSGRRRSGHRDGPRAAPGSHSHGSPAPKISGIDASAHAARPSRPPPAHADHRHHFVRAQRRPAEGEGRRRVRLHGQAV